LEPRRAMLLQASLMLSLVNSSSVRRCYWQLMPGVISARILDLISSACCLGSFKQPRQQRQVLGLAGLINSIWALEVARVGSPGVVLGRAPRIPKSESSIWKNLDHYRGDIKTSGTGADKRFYKWDHTHNDIEVYDRSGRHLGSLDPQTGEMYKPPVPGRKLDL